MVAFKIHCPECGLGTFVHVRERFSNEPQRQWFEYAKDRACMKHLILSPVCTSLEIDVTFTPLEVVRCSQ